MAEIKEQAMVDDKLRSVLDDLEEHELLDLRDAVAGSPDGSTHEIEGVRASKDQALQLINQALPVEADRGQERSDDGELRELLDSLEDEELLSLRDAVLSSRSGSTHEIHGVRVPRDRALRLINQALPVSGS